MRGLLLLSDPYHTQMNPQYWQSEAIKYNMEVEIGETAACNEPLLLHAEGRLQRSAANRDCPRGDFDLLSDFQYRLYRLRRRCEWICILAEGKLCSYALALAAQLPVDRLILLGKGCFACRDAGRSRRRISSFARRNLAFITAEIIAAGMEEADLRILRSGLGYHSGGLLALPDAAELWQKRETFLTSSFPALQEAFAGGKQLAD